MDAARIWMKYSWNYNGPNLPTFTCVPSFHVSSIVFPEASTVVRRFFPGTSHWKSGGFLKKSKTH